MVSTLLRTNTTFLPQARISSRKARSLSVNGRSAEVTKRTRSALGTNSRVIASCSRRTALVPGVSTTWTSRSSSTGAVTNTMPRRVSRGFRLAPAQDVDLGGRRRHPLFEHVDEGALGRPTSALIKGALAGVELAGDDEEEEHRRAALHVDPVRPVLGGQAGDRPPPVAHGLPPVHLHHLLGATGPASPHPGAEPERDEPAHARRQALHRPGVQMVVMVVGEHGEGVLGDGPEGDARGREPLRHEGPRPPVGVGQEHLAAVLHGEGRVPHPGHRVRCSRVPQVAPVVLLDRDLQRPALVVVIAGQKLPAEDVQKSRGEPPPGVEEPAGLAVGCVEEVGDGISGLPDRGQDIPFPDNAAEQRPRPFLHRGPSEPAGGRRVKPRAAASGGALPQRAACRGKVRRAVARCGTLPQVAGACSTVLGRAATCGAVPQVAGPSSILRSRPAPCGAAQHLAEPSSTLRRAPAPWGGVPPPVLHAVQWWYYLA
jgi:hypothetical protein